MSYSIDRNDSASAAIRRNLARNQLDIGRTLERLSSGLRVNRAADDPYGITRIERTKGDILANGQARLNNQASSLMAATGADGASQILNQLQRMREIALASLNGSPTDLDRSRMQLEFGKLGQEIDRIARTTAYNGRNLLDGSTAAGSAGTAASYELDGERKLSDPVTGEQKSLFSSVSLDGEAGADVRFMFRLFNAPGSASTGLEIASSSGGVLATYADFTAAPTALSLSLSGAGGPYLRLNRSSFASLPNTPLTSAELDTPLQELVASGRIEAVTYGNLALTAGGQVFSSVMDVQGGTTINQVLGAINGLSNASGTFSASYDVGTGRVSVGYTGRRQAISSADANYTPAVPGAAGGAFDAFALITSPPQGPAYRDPSSYLPAAGFAVGSAQNYFPALPGSVSAAFDLSGSDASLLSALGISSSSNRGTVTGYNTSYYGETVATGGQSEYVNRTRLTIDDVTAEQTISGGTTSLGAAELGETFRVLSTAVLNAPGFGAGAFSIDFGANGVFNFAGFDPATHTLQDVLGAINAFKPGYVSATLNGDDTLTISNNPQPAAIDSKLADPGLGAGGSFSIDFGSNGVFSYNLQPGTSTIDSFVAALNAFKPGSVSAGFDATTDQMTLSNTVTPTYQARVTDPGLAAGTFTIDFGSNGVFNYAFNPASQDLQDLIDGINAFKPGFVSASYDAASDRFSISNSSNPVSDVKAYSPSASAGTFTIDFGENGTFSFNFDPSLHRISDVVSAIDARAGVTASFDAGSDTLSITNTSSTSTAITASKVANPPLAAGTFSIDFGSNGTFSLANPQNYTIQGFVGAINGWSAANAGNRASASYDESSDRLTISNTPLNSSVPNYDTKINNAGLGTGTFAIDFGSNGELNLGTVNGANFSVNDLLNAINSYGGEQPGGAVSASWDAANDRLVISNTSVATSSSSTSTIGYKLSDPGIGNDQLRINFGANGTFVSAGALRNYTLDGIVGEINAWSAANAGGRVSASFNAGSDQIVLSNTSGDTPATAGVTKVNDPGFSTATGFRIHFGDDPPYGPNTMYFSRPISDYSINEIVAEINAFDFYGAPPMVVPPGSDVSASFDTNTDQLRIEYFAPDINGTPQFYRVIEFGGTDAAAFTNFFKLGGNNNSYTGSGYLQSVSSTSGIDNSTTSGAPGDIGVADLDTKLRDLVSQTYGGSPGSTGSNQIVFESPGANSLFQIGNAGNSNTDPNSGGDNTRVLSGGNIDNAGDSRLDITAADAAGRTINQLMTEAVTETVTTTTPGNNKIQFKDFGTGIQATLKIFDAPNTGTGLQTTTGSDIDKGTTHANLNISEAGGDLARSFSSLATTPVLTTTTFVPGNNQISINDGGTGAAAFFRLGGAGNTGTGAVQAVSSSGDIDRSSTSALLDVNGGDVTGKTLAQLVSEQIVYSGTPAGNNQIIFGGTSNLQSFFRIGNRASTGSGGANTALSAGDVDKSSSSGYAQLDIGAADVGTATIGSLQGSQVYLSGGNNSISFSGGTGLQSLLRLSDVASSGSGTRTATSSGDIDRSSASALLDIGSGDVNSLSFQSLISQPVLTSGGDNNAITFSAGLGQRVRDLFRLSDRPDNSPVALGSATYTQSTLSAGAIDRGGAGSPYDISAGDVTGTSFQSLITPFPSGSADNRIVFGGINGANLRELLNLNDVASNDTFAPRLSSSTAPIDNGALDSSLELDPGEVSGLTISQLTTPRLGPISGALVIDGGTVLTIDPDTTTLANLIDAINAYSGPSNKTYTAALNSGRLEIRVRDTETLTPGAVAAAQPNEATPRVSGNALIFDSAAYIAADAPKSVGGVPLNPTGTGPGEQAFAAAALDSRYNVSNPAAPADISGLSFGGATNLAGILGLGSAASGTPALIATEYQGVISATGSNSYSLSATTRQTFEASSSVSSSQPIGRTQSRIADSETGVVAEIQVYAQDAAVLGDHSLGFQYGRNEGDTESFGFSNLTAQQLGLEGLSLTGANDLQTRLRGANALQVIDRAINETLEQISRLGVFSGGMARQADAVASDSEQLERDLSAWQDADLAADIGTLTRQQITAQAAAAALAESRRNEQQIFELLFGIKSSKLSGESGSLLDGRM